MHPRHLLALAALLLAPHSALADLTSVDSLLALAGANDKTVGLMVRLLGSFASSPFSPGAASTMFGAVFLVLNTAIFLIGLLWASYGLLVGTVQTAHEGEVLGKRLSAVWMPIRMVTGIGGLLPLFGGFSLAQAVMMLATLLGIGTANAVWTLFVDRSSEFQSLMKPEITGATSGISPQGMAHAMFGSHVCMYAAQADAQSDSNAMPGQRSGRADTSSPSANKAAVVLRVYDSPVMPAGCGSVAITSLESFRGNVNDSWWRNLGTGFTVGSVDYRAVRSTLLASTPQAFAAMDAQVAALATQWYNSWRLSRDPSAMQPIPAPDVPIAALDAAAQTFLDAAVRPAQSLVAGGQSAITGGAAQAMKRDGWIGAGAWYATLAEQQASLLQAFKALEVKIKDPAALMVSGEVDYSTTAEDALKTYLKQYARVSGNNYSEAFDRSWNFENDTGNLSLGQMIVAKTIKTAALGSGGDAVGQGGATLINPITMMKDMGDTFVTMGWTALGAGIAMELMPTKWAAGALGKVATSGAKNAGASDDGAASRLAKLAGATKEMGSGILLIMFGLGVFMSIYLPFIPFIQWMGGVVQYMTVWIEGLVAAPLWAFAHLESEGEGMGQRSERGYLFVLNMLFRPVLMVIGFVTAGGLMVLVGTFQAVLFLPAMANVQGNSITGVASIVGLVSVFVVLNVTLIHSLFNMITLIPDQVIGWVGNAMGVQLGKDADDRANPLFMAASRSTTHAAEGARLRGGHSPVDLAAKNHRDRGRGRPGS